MMRRRVTDGSSRLAVESVERIAETFLAPFMIHEALPTLTETAFGGHPYCVVSVTYVGTHCFHGGVLKVSRQ